MELVAFDMDGTLLKEESSWRRVHEAFGTLDQGLRSLKEYEEGRITYREFMRRDLESWPKPLHIDVIKGILKGYTLADGAEEAIKEIKGMGLKTAIVSAGIDVLAYEVSERLGIDYTLANRLEVDERGFLTGEGVEIVDPARKHIALLQLLQTLHIPPERVIAVGDSIYDLSFLQCVGFGVALGPDPQLKKLVKYHIGSVKELPGLIREILKGDPSPQ